jgi:hypothetical protein
MLTFTNCYINVSSISFTTTNISAYGNTFITNVANGGAITAAILLQGTFAGANNTFGDNGALTNGPFLTMSGAVSFSSPSSTFEITGVIATGSIFNIPTTVPTFYVPESSFHVPNLNTSSSPALYTNITTTTTFSECHFLIGGTTSSHLFTITSGILTAKNTVFDCNSMTLAQFTTVASGAKMNISGAIVDMTSSATTSPALFTIVGTLIAPQTSFTGLQPGITMISVLSGGLANLVNCNYRLTTGTSVNGAGKADISPFVYAFAASTINGNSIYTPSFNDANYGVFITPQPGTTITSAAFVSAMTPSQFTYNVSSIGNFIATIVRSTSNIN